MRTFVQTRSTGVSRTAAQQPRTIAALPSPARAGTGVGGWSYAKIAVSADVSPRLQRRLRVGSIADPLEHEAERIAKKLIRMPDPQTATNASAVGMARGIHCGGPARPAQRMKMKRSPARSPRPVAIFCAPPMDRRPRSRAS
jgi:hypothetical protein